MPTPEQKTELLESYLKLQEATNMIVAGCAKVTQGGVEGIVDAARDEPETILAAIEALTSIIKVQQEEIQQLVKREFDILDMIDEASDSPEK